MSDVRIEPATPEHLDVVRAAYEHGRALQLAHTGLSWPAFTDSAILAEVGTGRLLRVMHGETLAGVFTVAYEDPIIWGEMERGRHVYLHRIARAPTFAGRGLLEEVLAWTHERCRALGRDGLRIDTWADNSALLGLYTRHGFHAVGRRTLYDERLPAHYYGTELVLLEE